MKFRQIGIFKQKNYKSNKKHGLLFKLTDKQFIAWIEKPKKKH